MQVEIGDIVEYGTDIGMVDFISNDYFTILVKKGEIRQRDVRVCIRWDSSYSVHKTSEDRLNAVLLEQLKEMYGSQHRDQRQSGTVACN